MPNGHFNIFINQFPFNLLLAQGDFFNASASDLACFMAWDTPLVTACGSHFCKAMVQLK